MKKISDETGAAIICLTWEFFLLLATAFNNTLAWVIFLFVTVILVLIVYFDDKIEKREKEAKRSRRLFIRQSENFMKSVYDRDEKRRADNDR